MTQDQALTILKTGANVFLTGEPGSGKTYTINQFVKYLREHDIEVAITASTGIAATHIGGQTIHSWSGIGIKKHLSLEDLDKLATNERVVKKVFKAKVLIIDEISMLDADTLSAVDASCRALRQRGDEPFGGLQVVCVGDFFQLPPISRMDSESSSFAFLSSAWQEANLLCCYLSEQHRQEDEDFLSLLSMIRSGEVTEYGHEMLTKRRVQANDVHTLTRLFCHNSNVDKINDEKLEAITGEVRVFMMTSVGPDALVLQLKKGCLSPESLRLKVGARVIFTKNNFETGFVNGTLGEVERFNIEGNPIVRTKSGKSIEVIPMEWSIVDGNRTLAKITQHPLRLAWAMTVHKSQGMTLDQVLIDLSEAFEYGQGYVALSRVKTFAGLFLLGFNQRSLQVHPEILLMDETFRSQSETVRQAFEKIPPAEQAIMEKNFILACGGKLGKIKVIKEKSGRIKVVKENTHEVTFSLWKKERSIDRIVAERAMTWSTIVGHLEKMRTDGTISLQDLEGIIPASLLAFVPEITKAFIELETEKLTPVFEKLGKRYSYDDLRLVRLTLPVKK